MARSPSTALPTGRGGQALAVALLLLAALVAWLGVVGPLVDWHARQADALERQQLLARRMEELAASLPALRQQAAQGDAGPAPSALLDGGSDAIAAAALQQAVQAMAAGTGARLSSVEIVPAEQAGLYRRVGLRLALTAPWPVLVALLQAIAQATPRMLVDDLQLRGSPIRAAALPLDASFTVIAFRAGTGGS